MGLLQCIFWVPDQSLNGQKKTKNIVIFEDSTEGVELAFEPKIVT